MKPSFRKGDILKMKILLIRHAEPDYTVDSLTPKGRVEAELLSRRMAGVPVDDFYVSPLGRAQDTAAYTLKALGRTVETLPWLAEFRGTCPDPETGESRYIAWDLKPRFWQNLRGVYNASSWADDPFFDGTNVREIWKETIDGVDALMARYGYRKDGPVWLCEHNTDRTIALFCHFGISMAVLAWLMDLSPMVLWQRALSLPSSVTEVVTEERIRGEVSFRLVRLGDITHLEAAGEKRSTSGLFPECYTGIDSTDPAVNGTLES